MKYFLHDSNARNDENITLLFIEYGYEGVGLFYTILEILSAQEKPVSEKVLKAQLNIRKKLEKPLSFMYKVGILSLRNGQVFNENLLKFSEKYTIKKEKNKKRISQWRENQEDEKNVTCYESVRNTPKDKISKDKISKDKISNKNIPKNGFLGEEIILEEEIKQEHHKPPKKKKTDPNFRPFKKMFEDYYKKITTTEYYWQVKDSVAINRLIVKIKFAYKNAEHQILNPTNEEMINGFEHILKRAEADKWINKNFEPTIIDSKFNNLKNVKNGTKEEQNRSVYEELLREFANND